MQNQQQQQRKKQQHDHHSTLGGVDTSVYGRQQYMNSNKTTSIAAQQRSHSNPYTQRQQRQSQQAQREGESSSAAAAAAAGSGGLKTKSVKDKKASVIAACEHSLSSQIGENLNTNELGVLEQVTDDMIAYGAQTLNGDVTTRDIGMMQQQQLQQLGVTNHIMRPYLRHLYNNMLQYGLQSYATELDKYSTVSQEDFRDRFPEVVVMKKNTDRSTTATGINILKRKRTEGRQHIEVEDLPENNHIFDDVDLSNLFTIDTYQLAQKRKLALAYNNIFKYSFEFDQHDDPVRHLSPGGIADNFFDVMAISQNFNPHPSKVKFMQEMHREDQLLNTARRLVLQERERIRHHDTQSEWKTMAREEIGDVFELLQEQKLHHLRLAKAFSHMCRAEVVTKKFKRTGQRAMDAPQRARLLNKEIITHWKKYEKELAERRKKKEKEEQERRKREQEMEEAKRQQKKLNFLLTQTELYSHFMARKSTQIPQDKAALSSNLNDLSGRDADGLTMENAYKKAERAFTSQRNATSAFDNESAKIRDDSDATVASAESVMGSMLDPSTMTMEEITEPQMFKGTLKKYQLKGLNWLASLYDQGINGILADEMGLGKTIQTIAFMAYLAEVKNIWGPFLVIVPSSTLHNWQQELNQFCPDLKVLPYWGNVKERRILRKYWNPQKLYKRSSPFHVLVTSYNLILEDDKMFNKIKWQYMILDEAHAIKSSKSARWKTLLRFQCRNRMLLTGTPIQNTMAELWALLHFIMPSLFDSHEEFDEWFSKDIESHAEQKGKLNEQQVARLHMILKPFMLRRVKKDVESEMPPKSEYTVSCPLSSMQKKLYAKLKRQLTVPRGATATATTTSKEPISRFTSNTSLMNYVMQFRKVCNHPDLFGQVGFTEPLQWQQEQAKQMPLLSADILGHLPIVVCTNRNPIDYEIPRLVADDLLDDMKDRRALLERKFLIFKSDYMQQSLSEHMNDDSGNDECTFSFARFTGHSLSELTHLFNGSMLDRFRALLRHREHMQMLHYAADELNEEESDSRRQRVLNQVRFLIHEMHDCTTSTHINSLHVHSDSRRMWEDLITTDPIARYENARPLIEVVDTFQEKAIAPPIELYCHSRKFAYKQYDMMYDPRIVLPMEGFSVRSCSKQSSQLMPLTSGDAMRDNIGLARNYRKLFGASQIHPPSMSKLVAGSGKMQVLDQLLKRLHRDGDRVLIFSQMTKMLDILGEYLYARRYKFFRLDGQTPIADRRDMVSTFQTDPSVFCFLLSTRAGGLGITLTAANTVIFYDSDWNPTMDEQAMDRVHRIGQQKPVSVYRLVARGTAEERVLKIAQQKSVIQSTVYGGQFKDKTDEVSAQDVMALVMDDSEGESEVEESISTESTETVQKLDSDTQQDQQQHADEISLNNGERDAAASASASHGNGQVKRKRGEEYFDTGESNGELRPPKFAKQNV